MKTECKREVLRFHGLGRREVLAAFDGGRITSDAGALLLREVEKRTAILRGFAACFTDHRNPERIEHTVEDLVAQRVYALALGYEDLNDHDELRHDALLAALIEKPDPTGNTRTCRRDRGKALAGKSTLNRLELTPADASVASRYKKIALNPEAVDRLLVNVFLAAHETPPTSIVIDLDATDDPLYGHQEGRFFHGYYDAYCYLPLYVFCGDHLLCARLRSSNIDASHGTLDELPRIVAQIRAAWPEVRITIRADSGFCREAIMAWCEDHGVDYVLGIAKNDRLLAAIAPELEQAKALYESTLQPARIFKDIRYRTLDTWSRERRVIGKAEHLDKGSNPRFVVTSHDTVGQTLYEKTYCARGDMENRIKEQQLHLFADRTSAQTMRANQIRLFFSSVAYTLMAALRRVALAGTALAKAECDTIRLKLLKIGARVKISVRRIFVSLAESYPYAALFREAFNNIVARPLMAAG